MTHVPSKRVEKCSSSTLVTSLFKIVNWKRRRALCVFVGSFRQVGCFNGGIVRYWKERELTVVNKLLQVPLGTGDAERKKVVFECCLLLINAANNVTQHNTSPWYYILGFFKIPSVHFTEIQVSMPIKWWLSSSQVDHKSPTCRCTNSQPSLIVMNPKIRSIE